jgi:ribosomal peptide maturation radical SAM protein 1
MPSPFETLLIVPPFTTPTRPSYAVHVLQACAREAGFPVTVFYAHLDFVATIGLEKYERVSAVRHDLMLGDRVFAAAAYGVPPLGRDGEELLAQHAQLEGGQPAGQQRRAIRLTAEQLRQIAALAGSWIERIAAEVAARPVKVVGCTSMFFQTSAAVALLNRIKELRPDIITIMGGPNCEAEMAEGVTTLSPLIDYIFSGESEQTFVHFLQQVAEEKLPTGRIIQGQPCQEMDSLPTPDFREFYEAVGHYLPDLAAQPNRLALVYESSRGCWWGQKHHCTFCGLNGMGMGFRQKSPEKVIAELEALLAAHPTSASVWVQMTDNIMPHSYFKALLPQLERVVEKAPWLTIFYEQKANLSLTQVEQLVKAGVRHIQPGIEALSTSLLKRMDKGVNVAHNVSLLRYARSLGMSLSWNLLRAFPGDERFEYEETLALLPLLHHLEPPSGFFHLTVDRFSPYFERPENYGIEAIGPWPGYKMILPAEANVNKVAYHFSGKYEAASRTHMDLVMQIEREIQKWKASWEKEIKVMGISMRTPPALRVSREADGQYLLTDTRGLPGTARRSEITREQASVALVGRPYQATPAMEWAVEQKVGLIVDKNYYMPLATARVELLREFENELSEQKQRRQPTAVIPLVSVS